MSQGFHVVDCLSGSSFSTSKAKSGSVLETRYEENLGGTNIARLMSARAKVGWRVEQCTTVASSANVAGLMIEMSRRCKTA